MLSPSRCAPPVNTPHAAFAPLHLSDATRADSAGPGSGAGFAEVVVFVLGLRLCTSQMPHARAALALSLFLLLCDRRWLARWERRWPCPCPSSCVVGAGLPGPPPARSALAGQLGAALALPLWVVTLASRVESATHLLLFSVQEPISQFSRRQQAERAAPINWDEFLPKKEAEVRAQHVNGILPNEYVYPVDYDKLAIPQPAFGDSYFHLCCWTDGKLYLPGYEVMEQEYMRQLHEPFDGPPPLWKDAAVAYDAVGLRQYLLDGVVISIQDQ